MKVLERGSKLRLAEEFTMTMPTDSSYGEIIRAIKRERGVKVNPSTVAVAKRNIARRRAEQTKADIGAEYTGRLISPIARTAMEFRDRRIVSEINGNGHVSIDAVQELLTACKKAGGIPKVMSLLEQINNEAE